MTIDLHKSVFLTLYLLLVFTYYLLFFRKAKNKNFNNFFIFSYVYFLYFMFNKINYITNENNTY